MEPHSLVAERIKLLRRALTNCQEAFNASVTPLPLTVSQDRSVTTLLVNKQINMSTNMF